MIDTR